MIYVEDVRACDVCRLVDGDLSPKPVKRCSVCRAWVCAGCWHDVVRRARAATLHAAEMYHRGDQPEVVGLKNL